VGSRPGTLVIPEQAEPPTIRAISYTPEIVNAVTVSNVEDIPAILESHTVTWVDIHGLGDENLERGKDSE
jgi:magnesium transporter